MAKYTTTVDSLLKMNFDFGLDKYPIWEEDYRKILNDKILDHYRFREIGFETPALFKFMLNREMNEIMPRFNELYKTTILEYNPLNNVDYKIEHTKTVKSENTGSSTSSGSTTSTGTTSANSEDHGKTVSIDTPQNAISIGEDVNNVSHASNVGLSKGSSTSNGSSTSSGTDTNTTTSSGVGDETETFIQHLVGNYGVMSSQKLIGETRELIINIDMMIINELHELFMEVY